jgi:hypothetical protein
LLTQTEDAFPTASSGSDKLLVSMKFTRTAALVHDFPVVAGAVGA